MPTIRPACRTDFVTAIAEDAATASGSAATRHRRASSLNPASVADVSALPSDAPDRERRGNVTALEFDRISRSGSAPPPASSASTRSPASAATAFRFPPGGARPTSASSISLVAGDGTLWAATGIGHPAHRARARSGRAGRRRRHRCQPRRWSSRRAARSMPEHANGLFRIDPVHGSSARVWPRKTQIASRARRAQHRPGYGRSPVVGGRARRARRLRSGQRRRRGGRNTITTCPDRCRKTM